ncbi:hypothetical protein ACH5RR_009607 [Cinchona calisaya]|uniref:Succinate dehydrogenase subunit 6, mitochondrial n=1 Tax=Cinchona calisaya TaxID=153742 RepID=A0ABD3AEL9_9GENT
MAEAESAYSEKGFSRATGKDTRNSGAKIFIYRELFQIYQASEASPILLKTARDAVKYGAVGSIVGAVTTAGWAWKYSRSLHGAGLSLAAGAVFGWTFGQEIAKHQQQLYRLDTMTAQTKFMEWWQKKVEGQ